VILVTAAVCKPSSAPVRGCAFRVCFVSLMTAGATESPRCLILDDHPVVRAGVRAVLERTWKDAKVADASSVEQIADAFEGDPPDVVIIDPWRAGVDVSEIVTSLQREVHAPIVIFTSDGGARLLSDALKAGVKGYVRKDSPSDDLIRAIEAARSGEFYVDPGLSSTIVLDEGDRTLSARQREILQMLADGMQTDAVAERLGLSTETVRTHTKRILAKLEASTRTQAVAIGIRHGLIE
jgi:DNA-binding NarL/FixJ family response regulator